MRYMQVIVDVATCIWEVDILLKMGTNGKLRTQRYHKRDDLNFSIVNFPYLCSPIPFSSFEWCLYLATYSVCKSLFDIRSLFNSRQSTEKVVDVTGVSTVSFTDSFPQILRSLQRSSFLQAKCCLVCFIPIVKSFLTHLY
jgi:hypothetical protein